MNKVSNKVNGFKEKLLFEISSGAHRQASRLPSEREMCLRYGISRTTVRQALRELIDDGVLNSEARRGFYIAPGALEVIGVTPEDHRLSVHFAIRPSQLGNPLIQTIFDTCRKFAEPGVRCTAVFEEELQPEQLEGFDADVLVLIGDRDERLLRQLSRRVGHLILVNAVSHHYNFIAPDNYQGGRMMGEFLFAMGHRHIGSVRGRGGADSEFGQRIFGCADFLEEAGVAQVAAFVPGEDIFQTAIPCIEAVAALFEADPKLTAIFCPADIIAMGIFSALRRRGLRLPDDVGVVAFDDQFYAQHTNPRLTTVKYPAEAMGIRLAETLQELMRSGECSIREMIAPVLIKRESVIDLAINHKSTREKSS